MAGSVAPWRVVSSTITYSDRWLTLRADDCLTAEGRRIAPYHVLEFPEWVNVVAVTADHRLVLVREYRHGAGEIVLGLVSGAVEAADKTEPQDVAETAARRELLEETGFAGATFQKVLESYANPANQSNRVTTYLALEVEWLANQALDATEAVEVVCEDFVEVLRRLRSGDLMMQAFHVAGLWAAVMCILTGEHSALRAKLIEAIT